jgi:hypothetical protein
MVVAYSTYQEFRTIGPTLLLVLLVTLRAQARDTPSGVALIHDDIE